MSDLIECVVPGVFFGTALVSPLEVIDRVNHAWVERDYETLLSLLHPEGAWVLVTDHPRRFHSADELIRALRIAQQTTAYGIVSEFSNEQLSDSFVLTSAAIRTPIAGSGGHDVRRHYFLNEVRDELLYRGEHFAREVEARAAFESRLRAL